jgi:TRAP-type C4-dicarboxylate transport system substrate-binding protein
MCRSWRSGLPEFGFFNRAFAFDDYPAFENAFSGRAGRALQQAALERLGIVMLASSYMGARQIALRTDRTVNNPSTLPASSCAFPARPTGLRWQDAGASATPMGLPDVYLAMQSGAIDAVENPISIIHSTKHDELMKQLVLTSHMIMTVHFSIAKTVFDKFTPAQQDVIREAAARAAAWNTQERLASEKTQFEDTNARG